MYFTHHGKTPWAVKSGLLQAAVAVLLFAVSSVRAEMPFEPVPASTAPSVNDLSNAPSPDSVFFTLTRTPVPEKELPTNVSVVRSETIEKLGLQNAGDAIDYLTSVDVQKNSGLGSSRLPKIRGFLNK